MEKNYETTDTHLLNSKTKLPVNYSQHPCQPHPHFPSQLLIDELP